MQQPDDPTTVVPTDSVGEAGEDVTTVTPARAPAAVIAAGESPTTVRPARQTEEYATSVEYLPAAATGHPTTVESLPVLTPPALPPTPGATAADPAGLPAVRQAPAPLPVPVSASPAGWYADPWSGGNAGTLRYWDGVDWTGYAAAGGVAAAGVTVVAPPRRGIPGWALFLWWLLIVVASAAAFPVLMLMAAFACDSGWEGCGQAGSDALVWYVVLTAALVTAPPIIAVLLGRGRRFGRVLRILAFVVMPLAPIAGIAAAYAVIASRYPG